MKDLVDFPKVTLEMDGNELATIGLLMGYFGSTHRDEMMEVLQEANAHFQLVQPAIFEEGDTMQFYISGLVKLTEALEKATEVTMEVVSKMDLSDMSGDLF